MKLNSSDIEALRILQEECAEVIQVVSKGCRFGFDVPYNGHTNRQLLTREVGDVLCLVNILIENKVIDLIDVRVAEDQKREKLRVWSTIFNND